MDKKDVLRATVELVSAYAGSLNEGVAYLSKECVEDYLLFIETVYKKVEELTK